MLKIGCFVPELSIQTDCGYFSLNEQIGKKVVVFFFPRADTSSCTKEAVQFSALGNDFTQENTVVIGISKDRPAKLAKFRLKHNLTCLLGADHGTDICERFGVWVKKSMYGKNFMGVQRSTYLIDTDRKIFSTWQKVRVDGHARDVLASVKSLKTKQD
jgi:peroxiredoxin Q/BCP